MITVVLFALAILIAVGNIAGEAGALRRRQRGDDRAFSTIPLLSILLSVAAFLTGPEPLGYWAFAPAALDPATWGLVYLPLFLLLRERK